ncbi:hypothetical protein [Frigoribacterium faeni]|nr:hypothetical protein [Frigoribacterium faeni]
MPDPTHPTTSPVPAGRAVRHDAAQPAPCLLYTSDAADDGCLV